MRNVEKALYEGFMKTELRKELRNWETLYIDREVPTVSFEIGGAKVLSQYGEYPSIQWKDWDDFNQYIEPILQNIELDGISYSKERLSFGDWIIRLPVKDVKMTFLESRYDDEPPAIEIEHGGGRVQLRRTDGKYFSHKFDYENMKNFVIDLFESHKVDMLWYDDSQKAIEVRQATNRLYVCQDAIRLLLQKDKTDGVFGILSRIKTSNYIKPYETLIYVGSLFDIEINFEKSKLGSSVFLSESDIEIGIDYLRISKYIEK